MTPRWLFFPTPASGAEIVGTCTTWAENSFQPIRRTGNYTAGDYGTGSTRIDLRSDSFGAFIVFNSSTNASAFVSANNSRDVVIEHDSGTYSWSSSAAGGMSVFATTNVRLSLSGWSGTLPGTGDASTISLG